MIGVRVSMHVMHDGRAEFACAGDRGVEIVHFEPEQDAVSNRGRGIAHGTVVVVDVPSVQLKDQAVGAPLAGVKPGIPQTFVLSPTVTSYASEKALVPAARGLNIVAVDQRLSAHTEILSASRAALSVLISQAQFAKLIGVNLRTLQNWEQQRTRPTGAARALLKIVASDPKAALEALRQ